MRVVLSWLKEFAPLPAEAGDGEAVAALAAVADSLGLVVERVEHVGTGLDGVVLARVLEIVPIEGADRIRAVLVEAGGDRPVPIVCGATNFSVGDVVPLATVGTTLPNGMTIERRTMRGALSEGMLCSPAELGIDTDASGLYVLFHGDDQLRPLPDGLEPGRPLAEYLGIEEDVVFDIAVEPNRPDCLSVVGIARDLAGKLHLPFSIPEVTLEESDPPAGELASVAISAPAYCRRLVGRVLSGVEVTASPPRLARRLSLSGMRPINSVVDASNYVMLELGQPTHPYDLDRLGGSGIRVRLARPGERLVLLDGSERALSSEDDEEANRFQDLVITDAEDRLVGLAGVMGGADTEIRPETRRVLLEVAHFDPVTVGRSAARLSMRSEASLRFWRGVDPEAQQRAADRFAELVGLAAREAGLAPPVVHRGLLEAGEGAPARRRVLLRITALNARLGTQLQRDEVVSYLAPIGFTSEPQADDLLVEVPPFRPDVSREVDLIEEVARHHGYDAIAPRQRRSPYVGRLTDAQRRRRVLHEVLRGVGCHEAWTATIVDPALAGTGYGAEHVRIENPIVRDEAALRAQLLPGLVGALRHNEGHRNGSLRLFETGRVFAKAGEDERPVEYEQCGALLARSGDDAGEAVRLLRRVLEVLGVESDGLELEALGEGDDSELAAGCHPTRSALAVVEGDGGGRLVLGAVGEVDPDLLEALGCERRRVGWLVLDVDAVLGAPVLGRVARPVSRFPSSDVDLSFVLSESVAAIRLERALREAAGPLAESVELIDVYRGEGVTDGHRSLTYRVRLSAPDKTLSDAELAKARAVLVEAGGAVGATLRA